MNCIIERRWVNGRVVRTYIRTEHIYSLFSICNKNLLSALFSFVHKLGLKDEKTQHQQQQQQTNEHREHKKGKAIQTSWLFINDSRYMLLGIEELLLSLLLHLRTQCKRENSSSNATVSFFYLIFLVFFCLQFYVIPFSHPITFNRYRSNHLQNTQTSSIVFISNEL